jgi:hypothetical protein
MRTLATPRMPMRRLARWTAAASILWFTGVPAGLAADFDLTAAEGKRVAKREIVIRANLEPGERRGTVRAAMLIDAQPAVVFEMMTHCADALQYVPRLRLCRVKDRAADLTWELVEHEIDFGWYAPRVRYVFRADLVRDFSITFRQVSGDFKANHGLWEFEPVDGGVRTLLRYRVYMDPPGFIPNWLARSTFKRELPQMLAGLRRHCEAEQKRRAQADTSPH